MTRDELLKMRVDAASRAHEAETEFGRGKQSRDR
jgi:hypothetical protein